MRCRKASVDSSGGDPDFSAAAFFMADDYNKNAETNETTDNKTQHNPATDG
jgi:hypothetical protein